MADDSRSSSAGSDYELVNQSNESESPSSKTSEMQKPEVKKQEEIRSSFCATYTKNGDFYYDDWCTISIPAGSRIRDAAKVLLEKTNEDDEFEYEAVRAINSRTHEPVDLNDQVEDGVDYSIEFDTAIKTTIFRHVNDGQLEKFVVSSDCKIDLLADVNGKAKIYLYNAFHGYCERDKYFPSLVKKNDYYWVCTDEYRRYNDFKLPLFRHFEDTAADQQKTKQTDEHTTNQRIFTVEEDAGDKKSDEDELTNGKSAEGKNKLLPPGFYIFPIPFCLLFGIVAVMYSQQTIELQQLQVQHERLGQTNSRLSLDLSYSKSEYEMATKKNTEIIRQNEELFAENAQRRSDFSDLEKKYNESIKQTEELSIEVEKLNHDLTQLPSAHFQLKTQHDESEKIRQQLAEVNKKWVQSVSDYSELGSKYAEMGKREEQLLLELGQVNRRVTELDMKTAELKTTPNAESQPKNAELQDDLSQCRMNLNGYQHAIKSLEWKIARKELKNSFP